MRRLIPLLVFALASMAHPGAGAASASIPPPVKELQVPSLDRVDSLAAAGRVEASREMLTAWWDARFQDAPPLQRQRALWLRGKLTVDPGMARRDYLRLVLEYPGGPHSADALLRLGQAEHGAGRTAAAGRYFEQLLRDYPDSPHRLEARRWLDENRAALARARAESETPAAPDTPASAPSRAEPSEPEPAPGGAPEAEPPAGDAPSAGNVSIQLGAFSSEERARELVREVTAAGFDDVRAVRLPGSRLIRVRAGRFPGRGDAGTLRARLLDAGYEAVIVTDADGEEPLP